MKVYLVENIETGERRKIYGKGTRVFIQKSAAIKAIGSGWGNQATQQCVEYELVPTGQTWGKQ